jgi:hypothetical protein
LRLARGVPILQPPERTEQTSCASASAWPQRPGYSVPWVTGSHRPPITGSLSSRVGGTCMAKSDMVMLTESCPGFTSSPWK